MARYIDADALKDWSEIVPLTGDGGIDINDFEEYLASMPAADVAPVRHGRWIRLDKDNMFFVPHMLKCSFCGNTLDKHGVNAGRGDANYCPNCGAQMGGWE